jgi:hypothetical protein
MLHLNVSFCELTYIYKRIVPLYLKKERIGYLVNHIDTVG